MSRLKGATVDPISRRHLATEIRFQTQEESVNVMELTCLSVSLSLAASHASRDRDNEGQRMHVRAWVHECHYVSLHVS